MGGITFRVKVRLSKIDVAALCPVCHVHAESVTHCFLTCEFAQRCWRTAGLGYISHNKGSFGSWLFALHNQVSSSDFKRVVMLCWAIWNTRND